MNWPAIIGLATMIGSETATLAGIEPFASWNTPIAWTGFIVFADSVVWHRRRHSWIRSAPREFAFLAFVSIPLWLVFEFYNLFIVNWYYVGLPTGVPLRALGYAWSFATIWPAIFEGAELVAVWRGPRAALPSTVPPATRVYSTLSVAAGGGLLLWPLLWPSPLLAAPVWIGFIFLLDPINARLGAESLWRDLVSGQHDRLTNLVISGFLCGFLWEFLNYWARAKWHYTVPILEHVKIFEMPIPGYFGFPAFALECFTMYVFVRAVATRAASRFGASVERTCGAEGRMIAL